MAKNNKLGQDLPELDAPPAKAEQKDAKKTTAKKPGKKRKSIGKFFRDVISELKKVSWGTFKRTKDNGGVIGQTSIVLFITLIFLVIITLIDTGLLQLLQLLLKAANPVA